MWGCTSDEGISRKHGEHHAVIDRKEHRKAKGGLRGKKISKKTEQTDDIPEHGMICDSCPNELNSDLSSEENPFVWIKITVDYPFPFMYDKDNEALGLVLLFGFRSCLP
ncbi:hypothetical protein CDAR_379431 [Caerostris darwini]|uniref:Uncharacterized protein n=1 Tax=Caerostris darwini TaxID=1538125 RepID=A0AAV4VAJ4_9ARAC|nr:hypothetical protein CDAR_379431 [Caerostris darwini]